jgi:small-conductance mechanosensitive channel/CRP-like cAMP-binding protein
MTDLLSQPWFIWALCVVLGLPVLLVLLTELHGGLQRRGNALAAPVLLLRNWVLPAGALILLLTEASDIAQTNVFVRIVTTFFGFMLLLLVLSGLNVVLFNQAAAGSWRQRLPSIFVDILRLVLIVTGLALIFAYVWNADVAGLFTALGVTTVVLGFALQHAVGSTLSGLLLLFEQPFRLGDWLQVGTVRGRIVEVNWRAVHLDHGGGVQIIPNASLAAAAFTNLSRPSDSHTEEITVTFDVVDAPDRVVALLERVATALPNRLPGVPPSAMMVGPGSYVTTIAVPDPAHGGPASGTFRRWIWYAAQRAGLHLDGAAHQEPTTETRRSATEAVMHHFGVPAQEAEEIVAAARIEQYGAGETILAPGAIPDELLIILDGAVVLRAPTADGALARVADLHPPEYLGQAVLTRQPVRAGGWAGSEVTALAVPLSVMDELVRRRPEVAVDISRTIDHRRERVLDVLHRSGIASGRRPPRTASAAPSA